MNAPKIVGLSETATKLLLQATYHVDGKANPKDQGLSGGAAQKVTASLIAKGYLTDELYLTDAGYEAVGRTRPAPQVDEPEVEEVDEPIEAEATEAKPRKQREGTVKQKAIELASRETGLPLQEAMETFGWLRHTTRGFFSLLGKAGWLVESTRSDAGTTYFVRGRKDDLQAA